MTIASELARFISLEAFTAKKYGLVDLLPYCYFVAPSIMLNSDGSFITSYYFGGVDYEGQDSDDLAYFSYLVNKALSKLANDGWSIHVDSIRSESIGYIKQEECYFTNQTAKLIDASRRIFFDKANTHFENEVIINFSYKPPLTSKFKGELFQYSEAGKPIGMLRHLETFRETLADVIAIFNTQFKLIQLTDDEILTHFNYCINCEKNYIKQSDYRIPLKYYLASNDLVGGFRLQVGDKYLGIVSLSEFPVDTYPAILNILNNLNLSYRWNTRYIFLSKKQAESKIKKIADLHYQKTESISQLLARRYGLNNPNKINRAHAEYAEDAEQAKASIELLNRSFGYYTSLVVVENVDLDLLEEQLKIIKGAINNAGFVAKIEKQNSLQSYLGSLPSMTHPNVRKFCMHALNLADLLPITRSWSGYSKNPSRYYQNNNPPLFYATTQDDTPFRVCNFIGDIGHTLVVGASRGGKSLLLNFMAVQHLRYKNAKVFIFDNGRSSLPICYAVNGTHYDLGSEESILFKPLEHLSGMEDFSATLQWVYDLFVVNDINLSVTDKQFITEILTTMLNEASSEQRTMSYFYHLLSAKDPELAINIKTYSDLTDRKNIQSKIFDSEVDNLKFSDFTVFELEILMKAGSTVLIPVIRYLLNMIERSCDGSPVAIFIDEAWAILKHPVFKVIIDEWLRKIAKKNCYIVMATQQLGDIMNSDIKDVLLDNCVTKYILPNSNALKHAANYQLLGLNENQIVNINNAITQQDYYFLNKLGARMFQLNLDPASLAFLGKTSLEDIALAKEIKIKYSNEFGYFWLQQHNLIEAGLLWKNL